MCWAFIPQLLGPSAVAYMQEQTGDYTMGFIAVGLLTLSASIPMIYLCIVTQQKLNRSDDDHYVKLPAWILPKCINNHFSKWYFSFQMLYFIVQHPWKFWSFSKKILKSKFLLSKVKVWNEIQKWDHTPKTSQLQSSVSKWVFSFFNGWTCVWKLRIHTFWS